MLNKKLINYGLAVALMAPVAFGLAGCGNKSGNEKAQVSAKDVYAMSAVTSASYLSELDSSTSFNYLLGADAGEAATTRPYSLTTAEIGLVNEYVNMFDTLLVNGLQQTSGKPAEADPYYETYNIVLSISVPTENGQTAYKMYYNETETETEREVEDDEEEINVSTKLEGIIVLGEQVFDVVGERNVETEGNETEVEIEFTTKSKTNRNNYIVVKQELENDEVEYEYSIYENGTLKSKTKLEFENEDDEEELSLQFKNVADGTLNKTVYKIKRAIGVNEFIVKYKTEVIEDIFAITKTEQGNVYTYSNGFSETI